MAAVYPAGPEPMMIRSRTPSCSAGGMAGCAGSVDTAGPGVGWEEFVTRGTTRMVGGPFPVGPLRRGSRSVGRLHGHLGEVGGEAAVRGHQAGDPDQHVAGAHGLAEA